MATGWSPVGSKGATSLKSGIARKFTSQAHLKRIRCSSAGCLPPRHVPNTGRDCAPPHHPRPAAGQRRALRARVSTHCPRRREGSILLSSRPSHRRAADRTPARRRLGAGDQDHVGAGRRRADRERRGRDAARMGGPIERIGDRHAREAQVVRGAASPRSRGTSRPRWRVIGGIRRVRQHDQRDVVPDRRPVGLEARGERGLRGSDGDHVRVGVRGSRIRGPGSASSSARRPSTRARRRTHRDTAAVVVALNENVRPALYMNEEVEAGTSATGAKSTLTPSARSAAPVLGALGRARPTCSRSRPSGSATGSAAPTGSA